MRRLWLLTFVAPLLAALACNDATSPPSAGGRAIRAPQRTLVIPSTTPQVSAGGYHTCALKTDGTVVCWGRNDFGQATVPGGLTSVAQVSAGYLHTCALKTDGTVVCWGYNGTGATTVPDGLASVAQVSAGANFTCALKTDGTVVCWGDNTYGQATVPAGLNLIVAAPQSISFTSISPSPAYVGATYAVTATATSGLPVAFSTSTPGTCSVSGGTVTFIAVGTCTVAADQAGDATHLAALEQTQSITVVKRPQTITFTSTAPNLPLVNATYAVTATASSGLAVSVTSLTPGTCTVTGSTATFVAAGSCTIAADQAGDATYLAAPEQKQSITIITAAQAVLNLITTVNSMSLSAGVASSLKAPLKNINTNNKAAACDKLNLFIDQVKAETPPLTGAQATQLLQAANAIKASLGCA
jgi:Regulator of chromosome condensation (RCC1) repeat